MQEVFDDAEMITERFCDLQKSPVAHTSTR